MAHTANAVEHESGKYECAMCRAPVTMTEKSGLGYCETHWRRVHPQRLRRLFRLIRRTPTPARVHPRFTHRAAS